MRGTGSRRSASRGNAVSRSRHERTVRFPTRNERAPAMRSSFTLAAMTACLTIATGCQSLVQHGWIAPPGPMNYQQANAVVHDPFPQADIGPDDKSMRPPDYQNPLPLPVRNQMKSQVAPWLHP